MSDPTLTPDLALAYLGELSTDIRAAAVLGSDGSLAAQTGFENEDVGAVDELVGEIFEHAAATANGGHAPDQVEVVLPEGTVFAIRDRNWTLAVVAGRFALSSLMFFDLRMVIKDLAGETTA